MTSHDVQEIVSCLDTGTRTLFHTYRDHYAALLLARLAASAPEGVAIAAVKRSPLARLLAKPRIADLVRQTDGRPLTTNMLATLWPSQSHAVYAYRLTLGAWGEKRYARWDQTSRGEANLVLQLNFSNRQALALEDLLPDAADRKWHPFVHTSHPVSEDLHTLAWARMDVDLASGTVLIEEVQSDWLRLVKRHRQRVREVRGAKSRAPDRRPLYRYAPSYSAE